MRGMAPVRKTNRCANQLKNFSTFFINRCVLPCSAKACAVLRANSCSGERSEPEHSIIFSWKASEASVRAPIFFLKKFFQTILKFFFAQKFCELMLLWPSTSEIWTWRLNDKWTGIDRRFEIKKNRFEQPLMRERERAPPSHSLSLIGKNEKTARNLLSNCDER